MDPASASLSPFTLNDATGCAYTFPTDGPTLLCFVKEDCDTCNTVLPLLEQIHQACGEDLTVLAAGQTAEGNELLRQRHSLKLPLLDDSSLKVSFTYVVDIVPTIILADGSGSELKRLEGFSKEEWQHLVRDLADLDVGGEVEIDWPAYPDWRPGCGSMSADPINAARLQAEVENSPLRARRIAIAEQDDVHEFMFDQGFSDGLPLIPPTAERVMKMLAGTRRDPQEPIATVPPNMGTATVEKVAINAVMAGCKPEYLVVIIAALEAACTDEFNIHGVMATTMGASPLMVINGPIRQRIGMNMKMSALGQGNRANASIGRALRLAIRNIGGAEPGGTERSTLGNPMKFTMCFAEWEERNPWQPLHVERGFEPNDSVVSLFAMTSGPTLIVDQSSRKAAQLAGSIGLGLESAQHPRAHMATNVVLVVSPEHIDTLMRDNYSKQDLRTRIQEVTTVPMRALVRDDTSGVGMDPDRIKDLPAEMLDRPMPKFRSEEDIHIVVAGSEAGKFSAAFHGWAVGPIGSIPVSRKIEEV
jgi:hypothetical protein|tara:strand:+ start:4549 stop:6141 length:1593 start_codon:yes stop_codon:yes gene_type:complete